MTERHGRDLDGSLRSVRSRMSLEINHGRVDGRGRVEHTRRSGERNRPRRVERRDDRRDPIATRPRNREEAFGDLTLHHDHHPIDAGRAPQGVENDPGSDVVREVGDERPRTLLEIACEVDVRGIFVPDLNVGKATDGIFQYPHEAGVDLIHNNTGAGRCECPGECAGPASDLHHTRRRRDIRESYDPSDDVRIDEEVLPVRLVRAESVVGEKATDRCLPLRARFIHVGFRRHGPSSGTCCGRRRLRPYPRSPRERCR